VSENSGRREDELWGVPFWERGIPPSPLLISEINKLAAKLEVIYAAQQVTGKILSRKHLEHFVQSWRILLRLGKDLLFEF